METTSPVIFLFIIGIGFIITNVLLLIAVFLLISIRFQMSRFLSDIESEKDTRSRSNKDIIDRLKQIYDIVRVYYHLGEKKE